ncbi:ATP-binding cassette domain-containing protein [Advenella sp. WQ 585]|uniref:ATP-binding cassette domain-containing protein n=1 Tax=Advenella mandrilli TaxID=2800330 RepID=A0ABS1EC06_9BURK|nr:ATP-binding cassette domain-containing protein [Advenella mandrilli]MBK1781459.1 ATP-binding cassette domain-containing protein [Advenella mandrilli]
MIFDINIQKKLVSASRTFMLDTQVCSHQDQVILFGPSGVGKSLTIKCIAGLLTPDSGGIKIKNRVLFDKEKNINIVPQERHVGYILQNYALFPHLTIEQNVGFGLNRKGLFNTVSRDNRENIYHWLDRFQITDLARQYPGQLSGGQQQRVALARALIIEPEILLLDEPFAALDKKLRIHMREEVKELQEELKIPLMLITHDEEDIKAFSADLIEFTSLKQVPKESF